MCLLFTGGRQSSNRMSNHFPADLSNAIQMCPVLPDLISIYFAYKEQDFLGVFFLSGLDGHFSRPSEGLAEF